MTSYENVFSLRIKQVKLFWDQFYPGILNTYAFIWNSLGDKPLPRPCQTLSSTRTFSEELELTHRQAQATWSRSALQQRVPPSLGSLCLHTTVLTHLSQPALILPICAYKCGEGKNSQGKGKTQTTTFGKCQLADTH